MSFCQDTLPDNSVCVEPVKGRDYVRCRVHQRMYEIALKQNMQQQEQVRRKIQELIQQRDLIRKVLSEKQVVPILVPSTLEPILLSSAHNNTVGSLPVLESPIPLLSPIPSWSPLPVIPWESPADLTLSPPPPMATELLSPDPVGTYPAF